MELGLLKIPKPEMEKFSFIHDIQTKLYIQYSNLVEKTELGKKVLEILNADQRVKNLENTMISKGSSASRFEVKNLAMW